MSWLLPGPEVVEHLRHLRVRAVSMLDRNRLAAASQRRWYITKGRDHLRRRRADPLFRARETERKKRWLSTEKGMAWLLKDRERRNARSRVRYHANITERRAYLNAKARTYRAAKKAACAPTSS